MTQRDRIHRPAAGAPRPLCDFASCPPSPLSTSGCAERRRILGVLESALAWRRRRRAARRGATALLAVSGLVALAVAIHSATTRRVETPIVTAALVPPSSHGTSPGAPPAPRRVLFERVGNRADLLARYTVENRPLARDVVIDDRQARALLAGAGRPAGRVCIAGRCFLELELARAEGWRR